MAISVAGLKRSLSGGRAALRARPVRIASPLTVEEASRRLRGGLTRPGWVEPAPWGTLRWAARGFPGGGEPARMVTGSVSPEKIRLSAYVPGVMNSWCPRFRGRLRAQDGGTELVGSFGLYPGVRAVLFVWAGGVTLFLVIGLISAIVLLVQGRGDDALTASMIAAVACGMLIFGLGLSSFGTRIGDRDEQWLTRWLEERLDAHRAPR